MLHVSGFICENGAVDRMRVARKAQAAQFAANVPRRGCRDDET